RFSTIFPGTQPIRMVHVNSSLAPRFMPAKERAKALSQSDQQAIIPMLVLAVVVIGVLPYLCLIMTWICAPNYLLPFFNHATGRLILLGLIGWEFLGLWLLVREARRGFSAILILKSIIAIVVFVLPLMALPIVGPALVTIIQAFLP